MAALTEQHGIVGIGYEGQNIDDFVAKLVKTGIHILADIRLNPVSRKRGFSKRPLAASLAEAGIEYWHAPELGNPKWNRAGFGGSPAEALEARGRFAAMIATEASGRRISQIADASLAALVAVMCFEADERACHRYVVIREAQQRLALCEAVI